MTTQEARLVTATEFVTDILCELSLHDVTTLRLVDTMEDKRFEKAFELLRDKRADLNVALDFSLATDPYHGDSSTLREAIYGLRERGVVAINNPSFKTVEIKVEPDDAQFYLNRSSIPRNILADIVERVFISQGGPDAEGRHTTAH